MNLGGESASSGSKIEHVAGCSRGLSDFHMSVVFVVLYKVANAFA